MNSARRHLVGTAHFELELGTPDVGPDSQLDRARYLRDHILPVAEAVFDEVGGEKEVLRVDRLELDLGAVVPGTPEFEERFRDRLRRALREVEFGGAGRPDDGGPGSRWVSRVEADLAQFTYFLRTGRLSWQSTPEGPRSLEKLARRIMAEDGGRLADFLWVSREDPVILDRFVRQMDDLALSEALSSMWGGRSQEWRAILLQFVALAREAGASETELEMLRRTLGRQLLDGGLEGVTDPQHPPEVSGSIGSKTGSLQPPYPGPSTPLEGGGVLRESSGALYEELTAALAEVIAGMPVPPRLDGGPRAIRLRPRAHERRQEEGPSDPPLAHVSERVERARVLEGALDSDAPAVVEKGLAAWLRNDPRGAADHLRNFLRSASARRALVRALSAPLLREVVRALDPRALDVIVRTLDAPARLQGDGFPEGGPGALDRALIAELSLAHLVLDGPDSFHADRYRKALAARLGIRRHHPSPPGQGAPSRSRLLRGYDLRDSILRTLADPKHAPRPRAREGVPRGESALEGPFDLTSALEELRLDHPHHIPALFRSLTEAGDAGLRRVGRLPSSELETLVRAWFEVEAGPPGSSVAWRGALRDLGERVSDPRAFLVDVLGHLVAGRWIDLEVLEERHLRSPAAPSGRPEGTSGALHGPPPRPPAGPSGPAEVTPVELDGRHLRPEGEAVAEVPPHPGPAAGEVLGLEQRLRDASRRTGRVGRDHRWIRLLVEKGLARSPKALRRELERSLEDVRSAVHLVEALPPGLFARVLRFLRSDPKAEWVRGVTAAGPAAVPAEVRDGPGVPVESGPPSPSGRPIELGRLLATLLRESSAPVHELVRVRTVVEWGLTHDPPWIRPSLERALEDPARAAILAEGLGEALLVRVLLLLRPGAAALLQGAELLTSALPLDAGLSEPPDALKWRFLARDLFAEEQVPDAKAFLRRYLTELLAAASVGDRDALRDEIRSRLAQRNGGWDRAWRELALAVLAEPDGSAGPGNPKGEVTFVADDVSVGPRAVRSGSKGGRTERVRGGHFEDEIFVSNAGVVLAAPYLPRLFTLLDLTHEGAFRSPDAAERAVHLLQYMVEGVADRPEYLLPLNKLLCGVPPGHPVPRRIEVTSGEAQEIRGLLDALITHWGALGNTSVSALQESFLQRAGILRREEDAWRLEVEPRAFDMLLDRLPWSFSTIRYRWMDRVLRVDWR